MANEDSSWAREIPYLYSAFRIFFLSSYSPKKHGVIFEGRIFNHLERPVSEDKLSRKVYLREDETCSPKLQTQNDQHHLS